MNEIVESAKKRERATAIAETCKGVNTILMIIFIIMCGLCATHTLEEWVMYPFTIVGGATLVVTTIILAIQDMKISNYEDSEE